MERVRSVGARRRKTRSGVVLTEDLIVDAALRLIESPSGDRLSVRRLGAELGADPTAVYRYFRDLDALLLAVADRLIGDAFADFVPRDHWVDSLRDLAHSLRRSMRQHPRLAHLRAIRVTAGPHEMRVVDTGIGIMLSAGFAPADAVRHYRDFVDTVLAVAAVDAAELTAGQETAEQEAWSRVYTSLPADGYPNVHLVREHLPSMYDSAFPGTIEKLLDALVQAAPTPA
ncbi:TetR/AcrR family transcriptional regulator [Actinoplanes hulinensis]|uniref:TetR/AcrR family transcriptional regulator n=1 Tax=Actinoplanes hulinensis TaxID=1144547 RepID=A0ABS7BCL1_9ACTN|nr:TetR/AcrR family transcriptional regulator [Actinoplanes hulinensis]